jgi:hypothetical protein
MSSSVLRWSLNRQPSSTVSPSSPHATPQSPQTERLWRRIRTMWLVLLISALFVTLFFGRPTSFQVIYAMLIRHGMTVESQAANRPSGLASS